MVTFWGVRMQAVEVACPRTSKSKMSDLQTVHCTHDDNDDDDDVVDTAPARSITTIRFPVIDTCARTHSRTHPTTPRARSGTTLLLFNSHGSVRAGELSPRDYKPSAPRSVRL